MAVTIKLVCIGLLLTITSTVFSQIALETPRVESILYTGSTENQPLIVGLGGAEGGNAWASDYWQDVRNQFIAKGYAFLAIGYFGAAGTPELLEKIAIEDVYFAIETATKNEKIDKRKIAIVGGSRGADLALLLGSYYDEIDCVVAIVPSNVVFPGNTDHFTTSTWTYQKEELPFVPVNDEAVPFLINRDLRSAFEVMLTDSVAAEKAAIKVENINGPILLLSATNDEICPSTPMANNMVARLKKSHFKYYHNHIAIKGGHIEPLKHFDLVFEFLGNHFATQ